QYGSESCNWSDYIFKYLLVTSNLLFSVLGLVTLVVGLWGLINKESFAQEKISGIGTDPMLLFCFLGLVLALLSLMGCVGALRENMCLLHLQGQIAEYLRSGMLAAMVRYQDDLDLRFITDEIQTGLQCCGADTYRDWEINELEGPNKDKQELNRNTHVTDIIINSNIIILSLIIIIKFIIFVILLTVIIS
uniref:Tetraspanin 10 n=1 Tax=Sinocyclocheilus anshuiensis TaxID=1608454 RepID=A0A671T9F7_9TELE